MKRLACGAAIILLALSGQVANAANLQFDFSNIVGAKVQFGSGVDAGKFWFTPTAADNFQVTAASPELASLVSAPGRLTGTFTIGAITVFGPLQAAPVAGTGTFSIKDSLSNVLSATAAWNDIYTLGSSGGINSAGTLNLTGWTYSGSDPGFLALLNGTEHSSTISFTFTPGRTLTQLKNSGGATSFSGTVSAVPVPSSLLGVLSLAVIGAVIAWRRRTS